jgi:hypothetical protein
MMEAESNEKNFLDICHEKNVYNNFITAIVRTSNPRHRYTEQGFRGKNTGFLTSLRK